MLTEKEIKALLLLHELYHMGETPECANWILRCLGLLEFAQSGVRKREAYNYQKGKEQ